MVNKDAPTASEEQAMNKAIARDEEVEEDTFSTTATATATATAIAEEEGNVDDDDEELFLRKVLAERCRCLGLGTQPSSLSESAGTVQNHSKNTEPNSEASSENRATSSNALSVPGAYAESCGGQLNGLQRMEPIEFDVLRRSATSSACSSYASSVVGNGDDQEDCDRTRRREIGLAVADPVDDLEVGAVEEVVEKKESSHFNSNGSCDRGKQRIILGLVWLLLAVGLAIGLISTFRQDIDQDVDQDQLMPNYVATGAPTSIDMEALMLSLMPSYTRDALRSPSSAQSLAFQWLLQDPALLTYPAWRIRQRFALAVLYFATNGDKWEENQNWLDYDHHECQWLTKPIPKELLMAIAENEVDHNASSLLNAMDDPCPTFDLESGDDPQRSAYIHLSFPQNNLHGTIPRELFWLTSLQTIRLIDNNLSGSLPTDVAKLTNLQSLGLPANELSGNIPSQIGLLSNLRSIGIISNRLTGSLPSELGQMDMLQIVHLEENQLSGPLPTELGSSPSLRFLSLSDNQLSEALPSDLGRMERLVAIKIDNNRIGFTIPTQIGSISSLKWLDLSNNQLEGRLPSLDQLVELDISGNPLLSGTVPSQLCGTEAALLLFDCSEILCGCQCNCTSPNQN